METNLCDFDDHDEVTKLWSLLEVQNPNVLQIAYAWQLLLTLPGFHFKAFPELKNLTDALRIVFRNHEKLVIADLIFISQQFGPLGVALEKLNSLFFDSEGNRTDYFHEQVETNEDANSVLSTQQPAGRFLFWIPRIAPKVLNLTYLQNDGSISTCHICNAGVDGFAYPSHEPKVFRTILELVEMFPDELISALPRSIKQTMNDQCSEQQFIEMLEESEDAFSRDAVTSLSLNDFSKFNSHEEEFQSSKKQIEDVILKIEKQPTNKSLLEAMLRKGAEYFGNYEYEKAAETFMDILLRIELWQKEESFCVNAQPSHIMHAACNCDICSAVRYSACALGNIGHVHFAKENIKLATLYFESSLPLLREIGLWKESPKVLSRLFECALLLNDSKRIRHYGIQKIGATQRKEKRATLLEQIKHAIGDEPKSVDSSEIEAELSKGFKHLFSTTRRVHALKHFGLALEMTRLCRPDEEVYYLEAKSLVYIGVVCYALARTCVALVHLEEALLMLRTGKCGTEGTDLRRIALTVIIRICETSGWRKTAVKYEQELQRINIS